MILSEKRLAALSKEIQEALSEIYEKEEARSLGNELLTHFINDYKIKRITDSEMTVDDDVLSSINDAFQQLMNSEPLQYILGQAQFYGEVYLVDRNVLIPRQETEELVNWILDELESEKRVLDIGTGSGCIAISLKLNGNNAIVHALDVSERALEIASENANKLNAEVRFINDDILHPTLQYEEYDVIVSNPPYVLNSEKELMHTNVVENEPHLALFVQDENPLVFYQAIIAFAKQHLKENGKLFFEINESKGKDIRELLEEAGYTEIEIRKDINGKDRMVKSVKLF